jgi:putative nucleotidyltransferase with HDIG domain
MSHQDRDTSSRQQLEQEARERFEQRRRAKLAVDALDDRKGDRKAHLDEAQLSRDIRAEAAREREREARHRSEEMARLRTQMREQRAAEKDEYLQAGVPEPRARKLSVSDKERVPLEEEIVRADKIYGQAVDYARGFLDDVRSGRAFDHRASEPVVDGFIDSVFRNESAASALCKLRNYDEYTYTHSINVAVLSIILGKHIGLDRDKLRLLGMAGMFHDVGKAVIPESILNKPGKLSDREMDVMRTHPREGFDILSKQPDMPPLVARAALEHHERFDGNGYPQKLKGEGISLISRIVGVVDVYDALTSKRVYKAPLPPGKVLGMMYQWRLSDFHPNIVEHFIKSLGIYPVGSFVRLSDGEFAIVMDHNPNAPLRPTVKIVYDYRMRPRPFRLVNLANPASNRKALLISDIVNARDHNIDVAKLMC